MLLLDFFDAIPTFYAWVFPLNVMITATILAGLAAGLLLRRASRVRWVLPVVCLCVMGAMELIWQLSYSEYLIVFYVCSWCAEAALVCFAAGTAVRLAWDQARSR